MTSCQPIFPAIACPNCRSTLTPKALLCVSCGYHLEKGQVVSAGLDTSQTTGDGRWNFAWLAFPMIAAATLGMLAWFGSTEFTSPGMSWSVGLLTMNLIVLAIGSYYTLQENSSGVSSEEKLLGWIASIIAALGCGFVALFFARWLPVFGALLGFHFALIVALYLSRRE